MCLAVPARVLDTREDGTLARSGRVDFGGVIRTISLAFVPEARVGDHVLVHAGIALCVLDPRRARELFDDLAALAMTAGDPDGDS
jgi:hydrogenase expression/formation protein HypC